uniref:Defensin-like protein n=1 Tax=Ipomoea trifida TaxID=35884 RepID=A4PHP8_IPOTF|nr:defensin-like protein [Ipomoea trifida]
MERFIKLFAIIFLLLALIYSDAEIEPMKIGHGGICYKNKVRPKSFKGLCFDEDKCKHACENEGFAGGKCVFPLCCCWRK